MDGPRMLQPIYESGPVQSRTYWNGVIVGGAIGFLLGVLCTNHILLEPVRDLKAKMKGIIYAMKVIFKETTKAASRTPNVATNAVAVPTTSTSVDAATKAVEQPRTHLDI